LSGPERARSTRTKPATPASRCDAIQQSFAIGSPTHSLSVQTINFGSVPPSGIVVGGSPYSWWRLQAPACLSTLGHHDSSGVCSVIGVTVLSTGSVPARFGRPVRATPTTRASRSCSSRSRSGSRCRRSAFSSTPPAARWSGFTSYNGAAAATSGLVVRLLGRSGQRKRLHGVGLDGEPVGAGTCTIDAISSATVRTRPLRRCNSRSPSAGARLVEHPVDQFQLDRTRRRRHRLVVYGRGRASSGLPVAFSAAASSAGVCTVSGVTVSFVGVGHVHRHANQAEWELPARSAGSAVVHGRQGVADDQLHQTPLRAQSSAVRRTTVSATSSSGLAGRVLGGREQCRSVHGLRLRSVARRPRDVHGQRRPAGDGTFQAAVEGSNRSPSLRLAERADDQLHLVAACGRAARRFPYAVSATASSGLPVSFSVDETSGRVHGLGVVGVARRFRNLHDRRKPFGNGSISGRRRLAVVRPSACVADHWLHLPTPPSPAGVGDPDYAVSALATSGLAVCCSPLRQRRHLLGLRIVRVPRRSRTCILNATSPATRRIRRATGAAFVSRSAGGPRCRACNRSTSRRRAPAAR